MQKLWEDMLKQEKLSADRIQESVEKIQKY